MTTKQILSGNEAIALGAYLAGATVASAYPGTPSSEILPAFFRFGGPHAEWATNEKVAYEVACGASYEGARAFAAMKHVGLNVAADPFFSSSYTGVSGGLVVVSTDDTGIYSSQNEQDNRHFARAAKVPLLDPSDSQECMEFMRIAFEVSEQFDTPVLLRTSTRISHGKGVVEYDPGSRVPVSVKGFQVDINKYVLLPAMARRRHVVVEERARKLQEYGEDSPLNRIEWGDRRLGVIASGISYQHAREALPEASFLKLGLSWPLPRRLVETFVKGVEKVVFIEEADPFLESEVKMMGLDVGSDRFIGKEAFTLLGEYSAGMIREALAKYPELGVTYEKPAAYRTSERLPDRPPVLCPGCSHRGVFYTLNRLKAVVYGDIGCYTLGVLPPLSAEHTCLCMGASITTNIGGEKAAGFAAQADTRPRVSVIGDSTFLHGGIVGLVHAAYNQTNTKILILDNRTTAMTGHQDHAATGKTLMGEPRKPVDFVKLAQACGVDDVKLLDPFDLRTFYREVKASLERPGPSVIVASYPCVFVDPRVKGRQPIFIEPEKCNNCGVCLRFGCPGVYRQDDKAVIEAAVCNGCAMCVQFCPTDAAGTQKAAKEAAGQSEGGL
ncbi:MAG: indolepyruvate ferredoxin oxidoreductase subunit alpha [Chloroflexi bacterium]|nr:indolepyruvate ferredoxin oxidoreductase subunit alpha [Chloroflexota bacterium]